MNNKNKNQAQRGFEMSTTWWDKKIKYVKEYPGLFRRSHFIAMMYASKKQHEKEMNEVRKQSEVKHGK